MTGLVAIAGADLRRVDLFDDLDDHALAVWAAAATVQRYAAGDTMVGQGECVRGLELLLEGTARSLIRDGDRRKPVALQEAPTWMSAISALVDLPTEVTVEAVTDCTTGLIETEVFRRLVFAHPAVHQRIMHQVGPVMSRIAAVEQQDQRLSALGSMAAGLAHELNNPAAAAGRAADQLQASINAIQSALPAVLGGRDAGALQALIERLPQRPGSHPSKRGIEIADAEDELLSALDELGVNDGWRMTEPLARAGVDADWVRAVAGAAGARAQPVISTLADAMAASALACELRDASHRMSYLVDVMKTYTYMDRGSLLDVDVHEGLEATVAMLSYRLEPAGTQVVRDFATGVPRIRTHGPDLNQAWTNLINNAIDAMGDGGSITLRTRRDGGAVRVEIIDDGPGIPAEVRDQVFDWFFTTRGVGEGAGLGLPAARQIVKANDGDIAIESRPGLTIATVWLPAQP